MWEWDAFSIPEISLSRCRFKTYVCNRRNHVASFFKEKVGKVFIAKLFLHTSNHHNGGSFPTGEKNTWVHFLRGMHLRAPLFPVQLSLTVHGCLLLCCHPGTRENKWNKDNHCEEMIDTFLAVSVGFHTSVACAHNEKCNHFHDKCALITHP